jgi:hypothetical protein
VASYSVVRAKHATLVGATVDTITLSGGIVNVLVTNRGSTDIYSTFDGTAPTVGGDDSYIILANTSKRVSFGTDQRSVVKLISSSTPAYSVEAY